MYERPEYFKIDHGIYREVVLDDCYRLPPNFGPDDLIVDIGAHIGIFALEAFRRGARHLVCCEPDPRNFRALEANIARHAVGSCFELHNKAVWRSDEPARPLRMSTFSEGDPAANTGGGSVAWTGKPTNATVPSVQFDELIGGRSVRFLKMDCEGSEYPILMTSNCLRQVHEVALEYHNPDWLPYDPQLEYPWDTGALVQTLLYVGFRHLSLEQHHPNFGYLHAMR